ncbi:hypothetical protein L7F22_045837 [Adiantum nelumboides]|nr:hypothetical protein [Adiantum nelumboides]
MRVLATLLEKDVPFDLVPVNLMKGEHKQPPFLALQPFGLIPVLQEEDFTLFESRAIARYVAEKYEKQGSALYGSTIAERALIEQWIEVEGQNYAPAGHPIFYQLVIGPMRGVPTDVALVEESLVKFEKVLDIYEERLGKTPYLGGESFSLADLTHLPLTHYLMNLPKVSPAFHSRKNVMAWWERISTRPAWKKVSAMSAS